MKALAKSVMAVAMAGVMGCGGGGRGVASSEMDITPPPETCPPGQTGTPPSCVTPPSPTCPPGEGGLSPPVGGGLSPPCTPLLPSEHCPPGQTGTPPDCVAPTTPSCPPGQTGTPPHCLMPLPPGQCPPGRRGTFPDCMTRATGSVRVIDGDTVDVDGVRYRLAGIDAPERAQTCRAWGRTWACGEAATEALMSRMAGMRCEGSGTDRYGRVLGVCSSGGADLNAWLVENGWALAYRQDSEDYASEEEGARGARRGMHRGAFVEPWSWRRGERIEGQDTFAGVASTALDVGALADRMLRGDFEDVYGVWLEDSVFAIVDDTTAVSFGAWSGTNPTGIGGGAVWTGAAVVVDSRTGERGDVGVRVSIEDFAEPEVDIALTVRDGDAIREREFAWEDIPVVEGRFGRRGAAGSIEGRFYGVDHGEVGGIFEKESLTGAFGGERDERTASSEH